ncbi:DNA-processing protein DprA [uncultured Planktosalinus sp.]|uniref:DNA-processing protein DprA n=1 Tax=uncultured Planktosalinus sp. TaxID=1810935 RepID=UPI0030D932D2
MTKEELFYTLVLQKVPNLGDASAKKLIQKAGSPKAVFTEKKATLMKIDGIGSFKLKDLYSKDYYVLAEDELKFIESNEIKTTYFKEDHYPEKLKHCLDGPILFFQRGNINLNKKRIISVVGTRKVTSYGVRLCEELIEELTPLDPVIISGFAYGVDISAHKAALKNNLQTIGCLAHGLNQIYPKTHHKYIKDVEYNGGFITEFWSSDVFDRNNFLKRNRIIAGISEATIVIESAEKGGSLVTANIANSYNRDVFAVPGRISDTQSQGCNNLIKTQRAHLLTSAADLIYILNWNLGKEKPKTIQKQLFVELEEEEQKIYNYLKAQNKAHIDTIAINCSMPVFKITTELLKLELKGVVRPLPGKIFEIC